VNLMHPQNGKFNSLTGKSDSLTEVESIYPRSMRVVAICCFAISVCVFVYVLYCCISACAVFPDDRTLKDYGEVQGVSTIGEEAGIILAVIFQLIVLIMQCLLTLSSTRIEKYREFENKTATFGGFNDTRSLRYRVSSMVIGISVNFVCGSFVMAFISLSVIKHAKEVFGI
jgi:hypothetical protein